MNQKEYELIARTVVGWYNVYNISYMQYDGLINHFADRLEITYKNFDRGLFIDACHENIKSEK